MDIQNKQTAPLLGEGRDDLDEVIGFIESLICLDEWSQTFRLSQEERHHLKLLLAQTNTGKIPTRDERPRFDALVLEGAKFVKAGKTYRQLKEQHYQAETATRLQRNGYPLSQFPKLKQAIPTTPADCAALKDWPDARQPANGHSGRLENAGQFMQRLIDQKIYDEAVYGKLYLHDLRQINPKFYLALAQWQNRNPDHKILENKQAELLDLELKSPANLSFNDKARLSNARWRKRRQE